MNSKERMLAALECREVDYVPCSFMLFQGLYYKIRTDREFLERQLEYGLDAYAHVGYLNHSLHPETEHRQWVERQDGLTHFCRRIDTPAGPLTQRLRQRDGWPEEGNFPLFNDYVVTRAEEILVKPERDLEKVKYLFGPFKDEDIDRLRQSARQAKQIADSRGLLQVGGWKGIMGPGLTPATRGDSDAGVMGCDAMAWLSGFEDIMILSISRPEVVREYAEIIHRWNARQIEIYLDVTEADVIFRRAWYESTEFWTPKAYRQLVAPLLRKEVELTHQAGRKFAYLITSAFLPILDDILDTGVDVLIGIDPLEGKGTELPVVKEKFSAKGRCLWGGVSGAVTVERGTPAQTRQGLVDALETLGKGGGFILSPVDNVNADTDLAWRNTQVLVDTWKEHRGRTF